MKFPEIVDEFVVARNQHYAFVVAQIPLHNSAIEEGVPNHLWIPVVRHHHQPVYMALDGQSFSKQLAIRSLLKEVTLPGFSFGAPTEYARVCRRCGCSEGDCSQCIRGSGVPCGWLIPWVCTACAMDRTTVTEAVDNLFREFVAPKFGRIHFRPIHLSIPGLEFPETFRLQVWLPGCIVFEVGSAHEARLVIETYQRDQERNGVAS